MQIVLAFIISTLVTFQIFPAALSFGDGLIPPTRTLGHDGKQWGRLTVFSEPPGLDVFLDDNKVGVTPLWLDRVEPGMHTMRIKDKDSQIYVEQRKRMKVGLFKGSFISMEEKEAVATPQPGLEEKAEPRGRSIAQPTQEEREKDLTRWDLFINGSLPFF